MSLRLARKSTIWPTATSADSRTNVALPRSAGLSASRVLVQAAPAPTPEASTPRSARRPCVDWLGARLHDPAQRRVARRSQQLRSHDQRRRRRLQDVVAGSAEPMNADASVSRCDLRRVREVGQTEAGSQRRANDAAQAIGRIRAGEDEVVLELLERRRQDVHRCPNVRAPNSIVRPRERHASRPWRVPCAAPRCRPPARESARSPRHHAPRSA